MASNRSEVLRSLAGIPAGLIGAGRRLMEARRPPSDSVDAETVLVPPEVETDPERFRLDVGSVCARLASAPDARAVAHIVTEEGLAGLGATFASVDFRHPESTELERLEWWDIAVGILGPGLPPTLPLTSPFPVAEVARSGVPLVLDEAAIRARFPTLVGNLMRVADWGWVFMPMRVLGSAEPAGVLSAGFAGEPDRVVLDTMARLADATGSALRRSEMQSAEREAGVALQQATDYRIERRVGGVTCAGRYDPAANPLAVGGDWLDAIVVDDQRLVAVIGDVVGRGVPAALAMTRLRGAARVVAGSRGPAEVVKALDLMAEEDPTSFGSSVLCVRFDLGAGRLEWCSAGHPAPVLMRGGLPTLLTEGVGPVLGVGSAERRVATRSLAGVTAFVAYTDGLVERRSESADAGVHRLLGLLTVLGEAAAPAEWCDAIADGCGPVGDDDRAVVVVRIDRSVDAQLDLFAD